MPNRRHPTRRSRPRAALLQESASGAPAGPLVLTEASTRSVSPSPGGRQLVRLIDAGWGSSGFYSPQVLEAAAKARVFAAGTHMYLDHPTASEDYERPVRSVRDLAAVLTEDAQYDPASDALVASVRVFAPYRETLADLSEHIGVSIRAEGVFEAGAAEGREGRIVTELTRALSVDYVTQAGRGGKVLALMESARARPAQEAGTVGAWLESRLHLALTQFADDMYGAGRLTRAERITLSSALGDGLQAWAARVEADAPALFQRGLYDDPPAGDVEEAPAEDTRTLLYAALNVAYGGEKRWAWMKDFDPDRGVVWFQTHDEERRERLWQQGYTLTDGRADLTGERVEVRARTVYDRVGATAAESDYAHDSGRFYIPQPGQGRALLEAAAKWLENAATATRTPTPADTGAADDRPAPPAGDNPTPGSTPDTTPDQEGSMSGDTTNTPTTPVAEAATAAVTPDPAVVAQLTEAKAANAKLQRELAGYRAGREAEPIVAEALAASKLAAPAQAKVRAVVLAALPLTESLALDVRALRDRVDAEVTAEAAYVTALAEADAAGRQAAGEGQVAGLGSTPSFGEAATTAPDPKAVSALEEAYIARGMSPTAAKLAAVRPA